MDAPKTKSLFLPMLKELPPALKVRKANDDNGFWVYATREVVDSMGDMVRVDGVDMKPYHNPPDTHLKILAQHLRSLPDGTAPVIARVTDYVKMVVPYDGRMVKALCLYREWLRNDKGELLELAGKYKEMKDSGGIDSVSVGLMVNAWEAIKDESGESTGGWDITQSTLYECSDVTIPANAGASFVRAMAVMGYGIDADPSSFIDKNSPPAWAKLLAEKASIDGLAGAMTTLHNTLKEMHGTMKSMGDRLEVLESAMVMLSDKEKPEDDPKPSDNGKDLAPLANALHAMRRNLGG